MNKQKKPLQISGFCLLNKRLISLSLPFSYVLSSPFIFQMNISFLLHSFNLQSSLTLYEETPIILVV